MRNEDHVWGRRHQSAAAGDGRGVAKAPARPKARGGSSQRLCSALGTRSRSKKRLSGWAGLVAGGRAGLGAGEEVRGLPRRGGWGAGTQPGLPGPQLPPRAQEQIVLGGGGGGSGPPRSQAENQQREAAGERGRGTAERSLAAVE